MKIAPLVRTLMNVVAVAGASLSGVAAVAEDAVAVASPTDQELIEKAQAMYADIARDPTGIQHRGWFIARLTLDAETAESVYMDPGTELVMACGETNAKNAFGGYTGWKETAVFLKSRGYDDVISESRYYDEFYIRDVCGVPIAGPFAPAPVGRTAAPDVP